ncbi:hypothetical protein [Roseovarius sp. EL26]|jgi:hypothetical protein|uniref:hypothetical protein n=1 Tax=Roseovarius sp. EL26 TaxID=2126672 RepID=UPI0013C4A104|nr:hypothetical protein [Roseovarius sp. EL26]
MTPRLILFSAAVTCAWALTATAQQNCAKRDLVLEKLASKYGETRQSVGLGANNTMIEVFASLESGTWTITATNAHGVTCLMASGQAFETLAEALPATGNEL